MFERVSQYDLMSRLGRWYRPRAYATLTPDGHWEGWLVFFPLNQGQPIASGPETIRFTRSDVVLWAAGLGAVSLDGALERALTLADESAVLTQLEAAEYEAWEDAAQLETVAAVERAEADLDEAAADAAREDAARIDRDRVTTEAVLAATRDVATTREVEEEAAREAQARALDAARRAASATADSTGTAKTSKRRGTGTNRKKPR